MPIDPVESILRFNAAREPERLARKYDKLRGSDFAFLRGTCHLFYQRLASEDALPPTPLAWVSGDLHLENFGGYKGENRLVYFDINDFDEACFAPIGWELVRFLASVQVAAPTLGISAGDAMRLCERFIGAYTDALVDGKARWVERDAAPGLAGRLLANLGRRRRIDLLNKRTVRDNNHRTLLLDHDHALEASKEQKRVVTHLVDRFATGQGDRRFFRVRDVARRVAGTSSLGLARYVVLVEGKGSPDRNYLLDVKEAQPSSLVACLKRIKQPAWDSEAQRVVAIEQRTQAVAPAFLHPISRRGTSYVLRALQPSEDRVELAALRGIEPMIVLVEEMARIVAWDQLRSAGRQGSAPADELIEFGNARAKWRRALRDQAHACAKQVSADRIAYVAAYKKGAFATAPGRGLRANQDLHARG
jgi:uncharacterized protein (DUF2252 family)